MTAMIEVGKEYGAALFMLACEENQQKAYAEALETVKTTFLDYPQYMELLSSPSIPLQERLGVIDEAFSSTVPEQVLSYLKLLCEKGRMPHFMESAKEYRALLDASEHVANAKITSAVELTKAEKEKLITRLESKEKCKVHAEYCVDPSLLGGLTIEVDGRILDGSLRHRLYEIKEVINT